MKNAERLVCGWGLVAILLWTGGCASSLVLTVEDTVCRTGDKARLAGKLGYRGLTGVHTGLKGRRVQFFVDDAPVGTGKTNDEGYAGVKCRFREAGVERVRVAYDGAREASVQTEGTVFVWEKEEPILVVDIDGTVCRTNGWSLLTAAEDCSPPIPGAAETLEELAKRFHVVYLTARPREFIPKTRGWLRAHGFPAGPVLTWDIDKYPWDAADYKKKRIDKLQDDFKYVRIGIGNTDKDYQAYRKRKMFSVVVDPDRPARRIERGVKVPDWRKVRQVFRDNPGLYDADLSNKIGVRGVGRWVD